MDSRTQQSCVTQVGLSNMFSLAATHPVQARAEGSRGGARRRVASQPINPFENTSFYGSSRRNRCFVRARMRLLAALLLLVAAAAAADNWAEADVFRAATMSCTPFCHSSVARDLGSPRVAKSDRPLSPLSFTPSLSCVYTKLSACNRTYPEIVVDREATCLSSRPPHLPPQLRGAALVPRRRHNATPPRTASGLVWRPTPPVISSNSRQRRRRPSHRASRTRPTLCG